MNIWKVLKFQILMVLDNNCAAQKKDLKECKGYSEISENYK